MNRLSLVKSDAPDTPDAEPAPWCGTCDKQPAVTGDTRCSFCVADQDAERPMPDLGDALAATLHAALSTAFRHGFRLGRISLTDAEDVAASQATYNETLDKLYAAAYNLRQAR